MDATTWNERYSQAEPVWPKSPNKWVVNEMGGHVPGVALDLGCGEGRNSIWLADQGWRVTAVDFALKALDRARERAREEAAQTGAELQISWVQADLTRYEAAAGRYDLVLLTYVHLLDFERRELLRNCVRRLQRETTNLRGLAEWPGMDRALASRLLNALYLQAGLIVSRSHPAAETDGWF